MKKLKFLILLLATLVPGANRSLADTVLTFGIVPQQSSTVTVERWSGVAQALEEIVGVDIELRVASDIRTFEACVKQGAFDFSYMNPYHYVVFSETPGYRAIAHRDGPGLSGIVAARSDAQTASLQDLNETRLSFPSPAAFGASLLVRQELKSRGIRFTPMFVTSHESVYLSVHARAFPAGGGVRRTFNAAPKEITQDLEIIYETDRYTPHAIAVHPGLDQSLSSELANALIGLHDTNPDSLLPLRVKGWKRPEADAYDDVRGLNIDPVDAGMNEIDGITCPFAQN